MLQWCKRVCVLCVSKASKCIRQWKQDSGQKQKNKKKIAWMDSKNGSLFQGSWWVTMWQCVSHLISKFCPLPLKGGLKHLRKSLTKKKKKNFQDTGDSSNEVHSSLEGRSWASSFKWFYDAIWKSESKIILNYKTKREIQITLKREESGMEEGVGRRKEKKR